MFTYDSLGGWRPPLKGAHGWRLLPRSSETLHCRTATMARRVGTSAERFSFDSTLSFSRSRPVLGERAQIIQKPRLFRVQCQPKPASLGKGRTHVPTYFCAPVSLMTRLARSFSMGNDASRLWTACFGLFLTASCGFGMADRNSDSIRSMRDSIEFRNSALHMPEHLPVRSKCGYHSPSGIWQITSSICPPSGRDASRDIESLVNDSWNIAASPAYHILSAWDEVVVSIRVDEAG